MMCLLPPFYNFSTIVIKPLKRTSCACDCLICQIGKLKLNEKHPLGLKAHNINLKDSISIKPEFLLILAFHQQKKDVPIVCQM